MQGPSQEPGRPASVRTLFIFLLVTLASGIGLFAFLTYYFEHITPPFAVSEGGMHMSDFIYHIILTKAFWNGEIGDPYDHLQQMQALSPYLPPNRQFLMPVGVSPIAFVLWFPCSLIAGISLNMALASWSSFSVLGFCVAVVFLSRALLPAHVERLSVGLLCVSLGSMLGAATIALGQSSLIAFAAFVVLILATDSFEQASISKRLPLVSAALFLLAMKPSYFLVAVLFLNCRIPRTLLFLSASPILVALLIFHIQAQETWLSSYREVLSQYASGSLPNYYAWSVRPETTNTLLSAATEFVESGVLHSLCSSLSAIAYCFLGLLGFLPSKHRGRRSLGVLFGALASFLLLSPYCGGYEDILLLLLPFIARLCVPANRAFPNRDFVFLFLALLLLFNPTYNLAAKPLVLMLAAKLLFVLYWFLRGSELDFKAREEVPTQR